MLIAFMSTDRAEISKIKAFRTVRDLAKAKRVCLWFPFICIEFVFGFCSVEGFMPFRFSHLPGASMIIGQSLSQNWIFCLNRIARLHRKIRAIVEVRMVVAN